MASFLSDVRLAGRSLTRTPLAATVAVLTIGTGISAVTTLFSVFDAVWLEPLPFREPDRLVVISLYDGNDRRIGMSFPDFVDLRAQASSFESLSAFNVADLNLAGTERPEPLLGVQVMGDFFGLIGMEAQIGRHLLPEDDAPDAGPAAVLSHDFWTERFGNDPGVLGSTLVLEGSSYRRIDRQAFTVVGVLPREAWFRFPAADVWIPFDLTDEERTNRSARTVWCVGRLRAGVSPEEAQAELDAVMARLEREYPDANAGLKLELDGIHRWIYGDNRRSVALLFGAASLLLCIACGNVAHLVLARTADRHREISLRAALGASRLRIAELLLSEVAVLAIAGGLLGLLLALAGVGMAVWIVPAELASQLPRGAEAIGLNVRVLFCALAASVITVMASGGVPLVRAVKVDIVRGLKGRSPEDSRRRAHPLVVSEIALCLLLLVGAGVTLRSFIALVSADLGFEPQGIISFWAGPSKAKYPGSVERRAFYRELHTRLSSLPEVGTFGLTDLLPQHAGWSLHQFDTETRRYGPERPAADVRSVDEGYFRTLQIPLMSGRLFDERDSETSAQVTIINESLADQYWPGTDPVGKLLHLEEGDDRVPLTIIGIAGSVRVPLLADDHPVIYRPWAQVPPDFVYFVVRPEGAPERAAESIRRAIWSVDSDQPVEGGAAWAFEDWVAGWFAKTRFAAILLGAFAVVALLLTTSGVFAVVSFHVQRRTHEMAIRKAVGAQDRDLTKLVLGRTLREAMIGIGIGMVAAWGLTRFLVALLYGVHPMDFITILGAATAVVAGALLASYLPALRLSRVQPSEALRSD